MKKTLLVALMLMLGMTATMAQKDAQIKFDELTHDFGTFSESNPVVTHTFTYTNVGEKPLVINQAVASCGCTVPLQEVHHRKDKRSGGDDTPIHRGNNGREEVNTLLTTHTGLIIFPCRRP